MWVYVYTYLCFHKFHVKLLLQAPEQQHNVLVKTNIVSTTEFGFEQLLPDLKIRLEIDVIFIILLAGALATRLYNLEDPKYIV